MNKHWAQVWIAAIFEVMWVIGLKYSNGIWSWLGTAVAVYISFYIMIRAANNLPVGTVYAVFVGLGTTGTVLSEIFFFGKPFDTAKLILIAVLLVGVIGLKVVTPDTDKSEGAKST